MARMVENITVPMARASILWLIGEYSERVPKIAPDVLRKMAKTFIQEVSMFLPFTINFFQNKPWFLHVCSTSLLKTPWEKEKFLVMSNFSISHCVFYPFEELSARYVKFETVVCKLFQF